MPIEKSPFDRLDSKLDYVKFKDIQRFRDWMIKEAMSLPVRLKGNRAIWYLIFKIEQRYKGFIEPSGKRFNDI